MNKQVIEFLSLPVELQFLILKDIDLGSYINFGTCCHESYSIARSQLPFYIKENYQHRLFKWTFPSRNEYPNHPLVKKLLLNEVKVLYGVYTLEVECMFHKTTSNATTDFQLYGSWLAKVKHKEDTFTYIFQGYIINNQVNGVVKHDDCGDIFVFTFKNGIRQKSIKRYKAGFTDISLYDENGRKSKLYAYKDDITPEEVQKYYPSLYGKSCVEKVNFDFERILSNTVPKLKFMGYITYDYVTNTCEHYVVNPTGHCTLEEQVRWEVTNKPDRYLYLYNGTKTEDTSNLDEAITRLLYQ